MDTLLLYLVAAICLIRKGEEDPFAPKTDAKEEKSTN